MRMQQIQCPSVQLIKIMTKWLMKNKVYYNVTYYEIVISDLKVESTKLLFRSLNTHFKIN